jgi:hypothetical protein
MLMLGSVHLGLIEMHRMSHTQDSKMQVIELARLSQRAIEPPPPAKVARVRLGSVATQEVEPRRSPKADKRADVSLSPLCANSRHCLDSTRSPSLVGTTA